MSTQTNPEDAAQEPILPQDAGIQVLTTQLEALGFQDAGSLVEALITPQVFSSPVATRPSIPAAPPQNRVMLQRRTREDSDGDPDAEPEEVEPPRARRRLAWDALNPLDLNAQVVGLVTEGFGQHPGFAHPPSPHNPTPSGVENTHPDITPLP